MTTQLPEKFMQRMQKQLPENEWEAFFAVYAQKPVKGVRLNVLKGGRDALKAKIPFLGDVVEWEENGFYTDREKLGSSVWHDAGLFYSQEPSAMKVAPLLDVQPGERVLDLCSAPGGKGTQLACAMQGDGVLVLNEPVFSRAKILSQNVERMGIKNGVVTCELPENLSKRFGGYFDKILVDAPCSGEGMFRKNAEEALREWSEENVQACAVRQARILNESVKMLKNGGKLAYSTCTFSMEEDEWQVENFLREHPEMRLITSEKLLPHTCKGEGHFVAVFEKSLTAETETSHIKTAITNVRRDSEKVYREFEKQFFKIPFAKRIYETDGTLYELPDGVFEWKGLQVLRVGVRLGDVRNGRFEPSHSLAMATCGEDCKNVLSLSETDDRVSGYLRGETIAGEIPNGWCLVCVDGYPLGLGKAVNGTVKNHFPKALRH